ncbi:MAG: hypothetical protein AAF721_08340 [Myxococcota bacterium]
MTLGRAACALLWLAACTSAVPPPELGPAPSSEPPEDQPAATAVETLLATVVIDAAPSGKRFQGVWLVEDGGWRHLISYRADPWWREFEGRRVKVVGMHYEPRGQAMSGDHFRVKKMEVADPTSADSIFSVTGEQTFSGVFDTKAWPMAAKGENGDTNVFVDLDGTEYWLHVPPSRMPALKQSVEIKAREIELLPFASKPSGRFLWVVDVVDPP